VGLEHSEPTTFSRAKSRKKAHNPESYQICQEMVVNSAVSARNEPAIECM
jgi:hypothetical protein